MSLKHLLDLVLHIDVQIHDLIRDYGFWTYAILFLVIFAETGLVVTPFLPGDTLLFAAGLFARPEKDFHFELPILLIVLTLAPIAGDTVNFHIGKFFGPKIFKSDKSRIFNKKAITKTHSFFEKYGPKAVMLARWVPVVRTFAPFVAGMSGMPFKRFITYSSAGAIIWVWVCVWAGFLLGKNQAVRDNFELAMLAMIGVTVLPIIVEMVKHRREAKRNKQQPPDDSA